MKGAPIRYSKAELRFIKSHRALGRRELHGVFVRKFKRRDVTPTHIKALCTRFGWTTGRRRAWLPKDDALLRRLYPDTPTEKLACRLGRTVTTTYGRAATLGLSKSAEYLASPASCRLRRGDNIGASTRFVKGQVPPNKGVRRPGWAPGRMKETQFKTGQSGYNWQPIGSERLIGGYRYVKVSDRRHVPYSVNWKPMHVLQWEKLHGRVPKGFVLKSLDANKENLDLANWALVPRGLLPRLNGIHGHGYDRAPAALKPTIMALAKLEHAAFVASSRTNRSTAAASG